MNTKQDLHRTDDLYNNCKLCPRNCGIDRRFNKGYCGQSHELRCARASLHMWEEPCISGKTGSGTVFFCGCSMKCVFCQNHEISGSNYGKVIDVNRLVDIFFELKDKGAKNINLVTPTHFVPTIARALNIAKGRNLNIPVVYNTSSFEHVETLKMLDGLVDIYLPDLKYMDDAIAIRYSHAPKYFEYAKKAIEEMVRQKSYIEWNEGQDLLKSGVVVRHMILPGHTKDSMNIIKYLYETYKDSIFISIMNQYTPVTDLSEYKEIDRRITKREYNKVVDYAINLGVVNGFIQGDKTAQDSFIPDFSDYFGV
ncbi:MAG: radical SAM protein [Lachnospiraceae bacterium]|nr:radical SAM protein [Lachnospiraceae bacterium]